MAALVRRPPRTAAAVRALHDDLLFLRAFPDDLVVRDAAAKALSKAARLLRTLSPRQRCLLDDSGMAGTTTRHTFAFGIARWLADSGEDAEIDWANYDNEDRLDPLLRLALTQAEADAFDSGEISTRDWLTLARGEGRSDALAWLTRSPPPSARDRARGPSPATLRLVYESLELPVRWRLTSATSASGNAVAEVVPVARQAMRPPPRDPVLHVTTPLETITRLPPARADAWLHAARAALAARCREVHAITYANRDEVYLADLGMGTALCLIGAARDDRLTLEANYGYVLFANGVPVGYGGVTPLSDQANTGINIFESFRHAEAAMLFAQTLRAFRTLFGVSRFIVNPYQFGAGNDEALSSGAYWFYDHLGFRPVDASARALANRERARLSASRKARSSPSTLRRLAAHDLVLELPGASGLPLFEERWLVTLARAVTQAMAAPDISARLERHDALCDHVARVLRLRRWRSAGNAARFGMLRLSPVLALIADDIARWPAHDRRALVHLLRAKGGAQERPFAVASRQHRALWEALQRRARELESGGG